MRLRRRKELVRLHGIEVQHPVCTEAMAHRAAILERFETAVQAQATARDLFERAQTARNRADQEHDCARKALRRVAEGAI